MPTYAHGITHSRPMRANGRHFNAANDSCPPDCCESCIGTGIGNPHVERSVCAACNGTGRVFPERHFVDEDRWAWNHFDPEPGEDDVAGTEGGAA